MYSLAGTPEPSLSPRIGTNWDSYTRALLVSKDRRLLFVTPWLLDFDDDAVAKGWKADVVRLSDVNHTPCIHVQYSRIVQLCAISAFY